MTLLSNPSFSTDNDHRFILVNHTMNFTDSELYCQHHYGTHLASFHTINEVLEAKSLCQSNVNGSCWVGLNDINNNNEYIYPSGAVFNSFISDFYPNQPISSPFLNCITINEAFDYQWHVWYCFDASIYPICDATTSNPTLSVTQFWTSSLTQFLTTNVPTNQPTFQTQPPTTNVPTTSLSPIYGCLTSEDIIYGTDITNVQIINQSVEIQLSITHPTDCSAPCDIFTIGDGNLTFFSLLVNTETGTYHMGRNDDYFITPYSENFTTHTIYIVINQQKIFMKADDNLPQIEYLSQCVALHNDSVYSLRFGTAPINKSSASICIQSPPKQFPDHDNAVVHGIIGETYKEVYYLFTQTSEEAVIFDSYTSDYLVTFSFHPFQVKQPMDIASIEPGEQYSKSDIGTQLVINSLPIGQYILGIHPNNGAISGAGTYFVLSNREISPRYTCGDTIEAEITEHYAVLTYIIRMPIKHDVFLNFCESSIGAGSRDLVWIDGVMLSSIANRWRSCGIGGSNNEIALTLDKGDHKMNVEIRDNNIDLIIGLTRTFVADVICIDSDAANRYIASLEYVDAPISWVDAQWACLQKFGTSLATITTEQDAFEVKQLLQLTINSSNTEISIGSMYIYVGLHTTPGYDGWRWIDASSGYVTFFP